MDCVLSKQSIYLLGFGYLPGTDHWMFVLSGLLQIGRDLWRLSVPAFTESRNCFDQIARDLFNFKYAPS